MKIEIIAEAAQGYEGDLTKALLLAKGAAQAKADAVKFQLVYADEITTKGHKDYHIHDSLKMPFTHWQKLVDQVHGDGIRMYLDVFGARSFREAVKLKVDGVKIHTTDFLNHELVSKALNHFKRVYIAFGGVEVQELQMFINRHQIENRSGVQFLYGFQAEPTPINKNNLHRLKALAEVFPSINFGFMDHEKGESPYALTLAIAALSQGISCVEKHITLDHSLQLEDYVSALTCDRFKQFVTGFRAHEKAMGNASLSVTADERKYRYKAAKVVVSSKSIRKGEVLNKNNIAFKRADHPAQEGYCMDMEEALGKSLKIGLSKDKPVESQYLK